MDQKRRRVKDNIDHCFVLAADFRQLKQNNDQYCLSLLSSNLTFRIDLPSIPSTQLKQNNDQYCLSHKYNSFILDTLEIQLLVIF